MEFNLSFKLDDKAILRSKKSPLIEGENEAENKEKKRNPITRAVEVLTMWISADGEVSEESLEKMGDIQRANKPELVNLGKY
jgi:hypothetical protein